MNDNKKDNTVYVVTSGEYDDYCIVGVCSTKEIAEKMVAIKNTKSMFKDARIEEYEMDELERYDNKK
jgi:hypothetical protein